jgi:hypothetical protein
MTSAFVSHERVSPNSILLTPRRHYLALIVYVFVRQQFHEGILRIIESHKTFPPINRRRTSIAFSGTDRTLANPGVTRIDRRIVRPINRTISFTSV